MPCKTSATCAPTFFFQAEDGIRDATVTGVQTCALPISATRGIRVMRRWTATVALSSGNVYEPSSGSERDRLEPDAPDRSGGRAGHHRPGHAGLAGHQHHGVHRPRAARVGGAVGVARGPGLAG